MIKLKYNFQVELNLGKEFSGINSMTKLMSFANSKAIAFGWKKNRESSASELNYWLAEITREGIRYRILPAEIIQQFKLVISGSLHEDSTRTQIQAFKFGEAFGLLLGSEYIYLLDDIDASPQLLKIENHFRLFSAPKYNSFKKDSHFMPVHCGNPSGNLLPVVFSSPEDSGNGGRHVCLLEIDEQSKQAKWLSTQELGIPRSTKFNDYKPYSKTGTGGARLTNNSINMDLPPLIHDCAWIDEYWHLFVAGYNPVYQRDGVSPSILTRNHVDLSLHAPVFQPVDESLAHICASLDRVIVSPFFSSGQRKGKQSIYVLNEGMEYELTLPRGYSKFAVQEYCDGVYWLTPGKLGFNSMPFNVVACSAPD
ncbi:hypothetical protein ACO0LC_18730 [Undibacterium sp. JH2W]|uniref:hypothetical protein n=1 Tax=Undibacterium sp. JH2W TaxID=3413037 RepID=UPI003BEFDD99